MTTTTNTFSGSGKPPLTRSDVEERLRLVGNSRKLVLTGENVSQADLSNLDLSRTDLRGTNLFAANLSSANLRGADLRGTDLSNANFDTILRFV